jgi:DNA-binding transcriptional MerR regulator
VPGRGGGESYYPDETLDRIRVIRKYQADDLSLGEIAEIMRDCKVAVAGNREFADGTKAERLNNPDQIATILALYEDIKASFGAESLIHIEFEHIECDGQWIVRVPVVVYRRDNSKGRARLGKHGMGGGERGWYQTEKASCRRRQVSSQESVTEG